MVLKGICKVKIHGKLQSIKSTEISLKRTNSASLGVMEQIKYG